MVARVLYSFLDMEFQNSLNYRRTRQPALWRDTATVVPYSLRINYREIVSLLYTCDALILPPAAGLR